MKLRSMRRLTAHAIHLLRESRAPEAMACADRARALCPDDPWPLVVRALVCLHLKRPAEARSLTRRLVARDPRLVPAQVVLGDACAALLRLEEAHAAYTAATTAAPAPTTARYIARAHARILSRLERHDEALALLETARAAAPDPALPLEVERGWCLLAADRRDEALAAAEEASARWPDDRHVRRLVYEARARTRPSAEAAAELDRALASPGARDNAELWSVRARRASELGDWHREAECWLTAHALAPTEGFSRRQAGFAFRRAGELARAIACLEPEFLADPANVFVRNCLLSCLRTSGETPRALALLDRALAAHPHVRALLGVRRKLRNALAARS